MSAECVMTPEVQENRLNGQEQLYSKLSEKLIEDCKMDAEQKQDKGPPETQGPEQEQKKPRRKDTPVLYIHPVIPGVKLMKEENRAIFMEDEEKEWKN
ncbi:protein phosphatase 1 regulatory subunit 17-like [Acipenser oxyrinchus oxyrinchus]|uniref:Protein phosphatase 1 regulatory subunit 17-like n=1 Tax=Acipenser oxyrinchus oxyrinchus TaxID=40147 RepID=A0AAD8LTV4_ACIOX|nr:protein phosphatase 1 regulatory subunit 17-like [Acipenser oxyrinchus oxyrinchus]